MGMVEVGLRVVRGPDWKWGEQDGGAGHAGTVVEVGRPGSSTTPDRTVVVQWDAGARTNYRVGYQAAHDLTLLDNAPIGVKHPSHICDGCRQTAISGIRWKCNSCFDYDLCTNCYMGDKHDLAHPFIRYETASSKGVDVGARKNAEKIPLQGIFTGAKVQRGPDWDWGNQDGGEGKHGKVTEIRGWDNESGRSVANVTWASGSTNVYRVGHKGKVDLKVVWPATNGHIYFHHLPVLGKQEECSSSVEAAVAPVPRHLPFAVGERVRVVVSVDELRTMQEGHGGWNHKMAEFLDKVGVVHRITDKGDVRVQYEGYATRWTIHPQALARVTSYSPGDVVTVISDVAKVKEFQKGHGEWIEYMISALGKTGVVARVYSDGDLRVNVEGKTWTFNPLCVVPAPRSAEYNNTMRANERQDHNTEGGTSGGGHMATILHQLLDSEADSTVVDHLVREAAQGHTQAVAHLLEKQPDKVDGKSSGKTCLQVACHQGHMDMVRLLLDHKASLDIADDDGDLALHYAAFGNQPEIMELLLRKGASINVVNKARCSALHVAVNKQHAACVKVLVKYNCDVNVQDSYGDTALHDAIGKESVEILELLGNCPHLDVTLRNKRGFNVLHHAALKGNNFAAEKLVLRSRQLVDVRKEDGFAALHLAALNGHRQVAETLITLGKAAVNITNNKRQTPLLLAVSQGHCGVVELLVNHSADITACDEDGDTPLHLALLKNSTTSLTHPTHAPNITKILADIGQRGFKNNVSLALACFLAQRGCSVTSANHRNKTPLDLINDTNTIDLLQSYTPQAGGGSLARIEMDLKALDLAAESLRHHKIDQVSSECPGSPLIHPKPRSFSQPVSPARVVGETSKGAPIGQEPMNDCDVEKVEEDSGECSICVECPAEVVFQPCGHCLTCEDCSTRIKKCFQCHMVIMSKITKDGRTVSSKARQPSAERLRYLETKIAEIEEAHCCSICMERRRNVAFLCGHGACVICAQTLKTCHMCRKPISKKINLY
ncbi:E3 ubiquitin-protein ligase MIB2-like isoform X2 [Eriocheir sinensis]|uniref:E3 ubiquitin-protein ligase MIB2-like isoform X2 n=1 Tax=Eriocheir sinensis TaxID=95602 RepID=UPI0021CA31B0|nr:E3 ubiquitin-protein ligase MIB2-like isoform X2 [Eriocheir sinensis]